MQKLIEEITPFYTPEAIQEFKRKLKGTKKAPIPIKRTKIIEKKRALKNNVKSFEILLKNKLDPSVQFSST